MYSFAPFVLALLSAVSIFSTWRAFSTGKVRSGFVAFTREERPEIYWILMTTRVVATAIIISGTIYGLIYGTDALLRVITTLVHYFF